MKLISRMSRYSEPREVQTPNVFVSHTEWDYMGSAEFEFGAVPESLNRLRQLSANGEVQFYRITYQDHILRVICTPEQLENLEEAFFQGPFKEDPYFPWATPSRFAPSYPPTAWLKLDSQYPMAVFKDKKLAFLWAKELGLPTHA